MKRISFNILFIFVTSFIVFDCCKKKEEPKINLTFNNKVYTVISLTYKGETKDIPVGESLTFYDIEESSVSYSASTKGTKNDSIQIGLSLSWNGNISLSEGSVSLDLVNSKDYFYLKIKNTGLHYLKDLFVNYNLISQTFDDLTFPNDSTIYGTGYYIASDSSNIRLNYSDSANQIQYIQKNQGTDFTLPFIENQSVEINFSPFAKSISFKTSANPLTKGAIKQYATIVKI